MENEKEILTREGKANLESRLKQLIEIDKPKALSDLNLARSQGDLSENADYDAARERVQEIETEINRIQYALDHSIVLDEGSIKGQENICRLGSGKITVKNLTKGTVSTFMIVGSSEASPLEGKISNSCPVALAILGHHVGDIVEVKAKIPYQLVIEKIEN